MNFIKTETNIKDLFVLEPRVFKDSRGYFFESFKSSAFNEFGIDEAIVQSNQSSSTYGVIRGLHFQTGDYAQGKLVRCLSGQIYDVGVDLRDNSKTYGQHFGVELTAENKKMLFIPKGFAHGFSVLSEKAEVFYDVFGGEYNKESEGGIRFDDPDININWKVSDLIVSDKDLGLPFFKDFKSCF